jgi:hypothetical protein
MVKKYQDATPQPYYYKLALEGCNHQVILTPQEIGERTVDSRYSVSENGGGYDNFVICPKCSGEAGVLKDGDYCKNTVVHPGSYGHTALYWLLSAAAAATTGMSENNNNNSTVAADAVIFRSSNNDDDPYAIT